MAWCPYCHVWTLVMHQHIDKVPFPPKKRRKTRNTKTQCIENLVEAQALQLSSYSGHLEEGTLKWKHQFLFLVFPFREAISCCTSWVSIAMSVIPICMLWSAVMEHAGPCMVRTLHSRSRNAYVASDRGAVCLWDWSSRPMDGCRRLLFSFSCISTASGPHPIAGEPGTVQDLTQFPAAAQEGLQRQGELNSLQFAHKRGYFYQSCLP